MYEVKSIEEQIEVILKELSFTPKLKGYKLLIECLVISLTMDITNFDKELYPIVAEKNNINKSSVERSIRYLIDITFEKIKPDIIYKYFGNSISYQTGKATNKELINTLKSYIEV